jgi:glutamine synthetase
MTAAVVPPDLESVSVCVPDHYGRLAGKRIAAHRLRAVLEHGLAMPDFHLITGPDIQPSAGVAATGLRPLRVAMAELGLLAVSTQGEGGVGQAEINFPPSAPLQAADGHVLFKHAAKAIAQQRSCSVTFMAMPDECQPGSGCHLHLSLHDGAGSPCTAAGGQVPGAELSDRAQRFLAGLLAYTPELTLLHAPLVNSYRRLQPGGWAPAAAGWGPDNRAAMVRVIGSGPSLRMEFRLPGADANPYLTIAAALAAGIGGLEEEGIELPAATAPTAAVHRSAGAGPGPFPMDLTEAIQRLAESTLASRAFGEGVRDHVTSMARHELRLARRAVTDWELSRGFETA